MLKKITQTLSLPLLTTLMLTALTTNPLKPLGLNLETLTPVLAQTTEEQTRINVFQKANPSVVTIVYETPGVVHWGSGFIIRNDGLVLTNAHVLAEASQTVTVILANGQRLTADVIGFDGVGFDVAAVKIRNQTHLPALNFGSTTTQEGQSVYAIGSPLDYREFSNTFTSGVVSRVDTRSGLIQHDAPINQGNSGGPLLNSQGEVIGINTSLYNPNENDSTWVGISMAISIEKIQPFITALQQNDTTRIAQHSPNNQNNTAQALPLPMNGQTITGTLQAGDATLPNHTYTDVYTFQGRAGQQITLEMNSENMDSTLLLYFPVNDILVEQNDDISIHNYNARLIATLPYDGIYIVLANAFEQGETGTYQLRASIR